MPCPRRRCWSKEQGYQQKCFVETHRWLIGSVEGTRGYLWGKEGEEMEKRH